MGYRVSDVCAGCMSSAPGLFKYSGPVSSRGISRGGALCCRRREHTEAGSLYWTSTSFNLSFLHVQAARHFRLVTSALYFCVVLLVLHQCQVCLPPRRACHSRPRIFFCSDFCFGRCFVSLWRCCVRARARFPSILGRVNSSYGTPPNIIDFAMELLQQSRT